MADDPLAPKDQLDHLAKLADDRWREHDHLSKAEWRLSFGIWTVLLAATATLLTLPDTSDSLSPVFLVRASLVFAGLAVVGHWALLWRMHTKLAVLRKEMRFILDRRRELLSLPAENEDATGRASMAMQLFISILAAALVLATAIMLSFAGPESSGAIYGSIGNSANASQISSGESSASAVMAVLSYSPHIKGSGGAKGMFSQEELRIAGDFLRAVIGGDITLSITLDPVIRWPQSLWISLAGAMTKSGFNNRNPEHLAALQSLIDKASDAHMRAPKAPRP